MSKVTAVPLRMVSLLLFVLLLAACGGGSQNSAATVSGIAAAGSTLSGNVYLKDSATPARELVVPINPDGSFAVDVQGLTPPYLLKAVGVANSASRVLYSFATASGTANINPLSNLAVVLANGSDDLGSLYGAPDRSRMQAIMAAMPGAIASTRAALQPTLVKFGADKADFISDRYVANHAGLDLFFDMVAISSSNGYVNITTAAAATPTQIPVTDFRNHAIDVISDPVPSTGTVAIMPHSAVVAPGSSVRLAAMVVGSCTAHVNWSVVESNGGTITADGTYTAPATTGTYHVTATNVADATKSATATVTVTDQNMISVVSTGPGVYQVVGHNLANVGGMQCVITYDTSTLGTPQVTQGGLAAGAMLASNTATPGTVRWAMVHASGISGSGELITISFNQLGSSPGRIISMWMEVFGSNGKRIATVIDTQGLSPATTSSAQGGAAMVSGSASGTVAGGTGFVFSMESVSANQP